MISSKTKMVDEAFAANMKTTTCALLSMQAKHWLERPFKDG
jgi:hypothetical protein